MTLVLLVIFLVTAKPVLNPAIPVDLPAASQTEEAQTALSVVVSADGIIQVNGKSVDSAALTAVRRTALTNDPTLRAVIQADGGVPHRQVIDVLDRLRAAGVARVAFGAVPRDEPPHSP